MRSAIHGRFHRAVCQRFCARFAYACEGPHTHTWRAIVQTHCERCAGTFSTILCTYGKFNEGLTTPNFTEKEINCYKYMKKTLKQNIFMLITPMFSNVTRIHLHNLRISNYLILLFFDNAGGFDFRDQRLALFFLPLKSVLYDTKECSMFGVFYIANSGFIFVVSSKINLCNRVSYFWQCY